MKSHTRAGKRSTSVRDSSHRHLGSGQFGDKCRLDKDCRGGRGVWQIATAAISHSSGRKRRRPLAEGGSLFLRTRRAAGCQSFSGPATISVVRCARLSIRIHRSLRRLEGGGVAHRLIMTAAQHQTSTPLNIVLFVRQMALQMSGGCSIHLIPTSYAFLG